GGQAREETRVVPQRSDEEVDSKHASQSRRSRGLNMDFITVGNNAQVVEIPTRLHEALHHRKLVGRLQRNARRWWQNPRILNRIRGYHTKGKRILTDFARKVGKWIVDVAETLGANYIVLEDLNKMVCA
ncbi:MAG: hypothetical protein QW665_08775, partial [Metallosphaera sp.]